MIYLLLALSSIFLCQFAVGFINAPPILQNKHTNLLLLLSSPLDDFLGNIFGKDDDENVNCKEENNTPIKDDKDINEMSLSSFQQELAKRKEEEVLNNDVDEDENEEFDGYALRDCILAKYGVCFDVDFQRVDSYGFRTVYLVSVFIVYMSNNKL